MLGIGLFWLWLMTGGHIIAFGDGIPLPPPETRADGSLPILGTQSSDHLVAFDDGTPLPPPR